MRQYIYDTKTKNMSFLLTAYDLKKLGIKNHGFFLRLYNPRLQGLDPYDPELTHSELLMMINEIMINPWYYLREVARIPKQGDPRGVSYILNRGNLAMTWCILNGINSYLVLPRQIGKTESTVSILTWAFLFGMTNSEMLFLNYEQSRSEANLDKLKTQRELLPKALQLRYYINEEGKEVTGKDNIRSITCPVSKNSIVVRGKAVSTEAANKLGRGSTQPIQFIDEFEFINHIGLIMNSAGPAFVTAAKNARENSSLYGKIICSTPGDLDTNPGMDADAYVKNCATFSESWYDKPIDVVKDIIDANSGNDTVYIEFSYRQLGKDEEWFRTVCKAVNNDKTAIKREILLQRIRGSSDSPYEQEDLEDIDSRRGVIVGELELLSVFRMYLYEKIDPKKIYFVGVDVASGSGGDNSAIEVWDPYTERTVAEFKSKYISIPNLTKLIADLMLHHFPNSIYIIERNANGVSVIQSLMVEPILRQKLYRDNNADIFKDTTAQNKTILERDALTQRAYGINTLSDSRERMFGLLQSHVTEYKEKFVGNYLIDDILTLVRTRSGKVAAASGKHDDNVMAYLMCLYVFYFGNNLHKYGFIRGQLPTEEERNQGLETDNSMVWSQLSENDRDFFASSGINFEMENDTITQQTYLAQDNYRDKGLVDLRGIMGHDVGDKRSDDIERHITLDPYEYKMYLEREASLKEASTLAKQFGATSYAVQTFDEEDDLGEGDMSWFTPFL